ncbi:MAG: Lrp/AsnC family transcriptional regulator [Candidatus Micrarchaeota archaeon]|nr:Lrp/AsnC family transcriptional regulator [Candidatus Micrarchaeota archaeon]
MELDRKDKELLNLLYLNSRESFIGLGKKLRLSNTAVERRLYRLRKDGIIPLLFADVNLAKLGLKCYRLYFKFDVMDKEAERAVLEFFESYPRTLWGVVCEGEYDVLWRIIAKDEVEVESAMYLMVEKFGTKIIEKTVVATTYQTYLAWNKALGTERQSGFPIEKITEPQQVDAKDMLLLSLLYADARETTVSLSKQVSLTPDAVQYRIKRLVREKYILGYTAWFDAKKLGFNYYKFLIGFRSITREKEKQFLNHCLANDSIIFINKTIGSWDIELDIIVRNNAELHDFTRELKTKFGNIIGKHTFVSAVEERMLNPLRGAALSETKQSKAREIK